MDAEGVEAAAGEPAQLDKQALLYCERFVEFLTDLLSQVGRVENRKGSRGSVAVLAAVAGGCGSPRQGVAVSAVAEATEGMAAFVRAAHMPPALHPPLALALCTSPSVAQLPTRRFVHAVLEDRAVLVKCYMSRLYAHPQGRLFVQVGWGR